MERDDNIHRALDERESAVLRALVYDYIISGKPVGSRSFVKKYSFSISPATMRNIMFDLEGMGYLMQPHTSAGRVPTNFGYRFYVDLLQDTYEFQINKNVEINEDFLRKEVQLEKMFFSVTRMLSLISKYAGIMLTPNLDFTVVKHIELIPLDSDEILFILITRTGMVFNKKVTISSKLTQDEIYKCSSYLTGELRGYSLFEIKMEIFEKLREDSKNDYKKDVALDIAQLALTDETEAELYIDGIENLLRIPEMIEADRLNGILRIVEDKKILKSIMENNIVKDGVTTLIGDEITETNVTGCSIVASTYKIGNRKVGVLGVIGPTRMDYEKVVPLVDYIGRVVTDLLNKMSK